MGSLEINKLLVSLNPNTIKIYSFTPTGPGSVLQRVWGLFMRLSSTPESPSNPDSCESQVKPCVSQRLGFFSSWLVDIAWAVWMHLGPTVQRWPGIAKDGVSLVFMFPLHSADHSVL